MLVCHCRGITDREIVRCVQGGTLRPCDVARNSGAGTGCGGCMPLVKSIVQKAREGQCAGSAAAGGAGGKILR